MRVGVARCLSPLVCEGVQMLRTPGQASQNCDVGDPQGRGLKDPLVCDLPGFLHNTARHQHTTMNTTFFPMLLISLVLCVVCCFPW